MRRHLLTRADSKDDETRVRRVVNDSRGRPSRICRDRGASFREQVDGFHLTAFDDAAASSSAIISESRSTPASSAES